MGVPPGSFMQELTDFSLLWSQMLLTHCGVTGDADFHARYYPVAKGVLDHFSRCQRFDGMLEQFADKWDLVDWPRVYATVMTLNLRVPSSPQVATMSSLDVITMCSRRWSMRVSMAGSI